MVTRLLGFGAFRDKGVTAIHACGSAVEGVLISCYLQAYGT